MKITYLNLRRILLKNWNIKNEKQLKISKYFLYLGGYTGHVIKNIILYKHQFQKAIKNIKYLTNFKQIENLFDLTTEDHKKLNVIETMMTHKKYNNCSEFSLNEIKQKLYKSFNITISVHIENDSVTAENKILKALFYHIKEIEDKIEKVKEGEYNVSSVINLMKSEKYVNHVLHRLMFLFNLPMLEEKIYNCQEFQKLVDNIKISILNEIETNEKLMIAYLGYLGYVETRYNALIDNIKLSNNDTDNKGIIELIKTIMGKYGMLLKSKDNHHKSNNSTYSIVINPKLKNILSV